MRTRDEIMDKAAYFLDRRGRVSKQSVDYYDLTVKLETLLWVLDGDLDEVAAELDKLDAGRKVEEYQDRVGGEAE